MRSFENWFGIPLRFFALAIFLSSPKRSFDSIFKVLKLFRTKRVRLSVNTNIHAKPLTHACVCVCTAPFTLSRSLSLSLSIQFASSIFYLLLYLPVFSFIQSFTHSLTNNNNNHFWCRNMYGRLSLMPMPISLFVCTMALAMFAILIHALRCPLVTFYISL